MILSERPREGWSVVNEQGETVALDLEITPSCAAGLAREVIRLIQETRKNSGFDVSDRIALTWKAEGEMAEAFAEHRDLIAGEVLATTMAEAESVDTLTVRDAARLRVQGVPGVRRPAAQPRRAPRPGSTGAAWRVLALGRQAGDGAALPSSASSCWVK